MRFNLTNAAVETRINDDVIFSKPAWKFPHQMILRLNGKFGFENKNLSFGERKMMDTAKNLLVKEISVATNAQEAKVEKDLQMIFTVQ